MQPHPSLENDVMPVQANKTAAPYKAKKGEAYMNPKQLDHFRGVLNEIKLGLSQDIDRTVHTMQDEATAFADPNDRASQESDMSLELRNRDRERQTHQEHRQNAGQDRSRGLRLLRQMRRRNRTKPSGSTPDRNTLHRLQNTGRNQRAASSEIISGPGMRNPCRCAGIFLARKKTFDLHASFKPCHQIRNWAHNRTSQHHPAEIAY